ncbi:hypothetical protein ACMHYO_11415 [Allopusillimonas ginsengisoli]|uniref:hypothetical protein n=1 Tax=Allopusillimonas ginsengisoli TaxID=453575 RepID=UPI0039C05741
MKSLVTSPSVHPSGARLTRSSKLLWIGVLLVAAVLLASHAMASGGGNALTDLNDWIESELGGSVGLTIALVAFFSGLVSAIVTRAFMPILWGIGIGLTLGIFLEIVVNTMGFGMPVVVMGMPGLF